MLSRQNHLFILSLLSVCLLVMSACRAVRPVEKIGLIAPFEGLDRRTGYEALAAMRQALEAMPYAAMDLLPLALDDSSDPVRVQRAAQKLAVDPDVRAIIGPSAPALAVSLPEVFVDGSITWIAPYAVDPAGGFADPREADAWATELLAAVGAEARAHGAMRLVLAGTADGWPTLTPEQWSIHVGLPVIEQNEPALVERADAVFWRGDAAHGAAYLNELRSSRPSVQFWLGPAGGNPIFSELAQTMTSVYWATWTDLEYNRWKIDRSPSSLQAYQVYRATEAAFGQLLGGAVSSPSPWYVATYSLDDADVSSHFSAE